MSLNRDLNDLIPEMKEKAENMLYRLNQAGIRVMVNETRRSLEIQKAYFMQGRFPLDKVNSSRTEAGLWKISDSENEYPVTWTLKSKHLEGKAIDIVPVNPQGKPWWKAPWVVWERIGRVGEECGLLWGGRWKGKDGKPRPDCPHFEVE